MDNENTNNQNPGDEIELVSDRSGLAVIGDPLAIDRFLVAEGLSATDMGLSRLRPSLGDAGAAVMAASEIAANSGRWMKLTEESAKAAQKYGMVRNSTTGFVHATLRGSEKGRFVKNLQFVNRPGELLGHPITMLTNPAMLAGVGGLMSQMAMQQAMEEITEYLAVIDAKVDDVLRAQKDAVLADMIAVGLMLDEAITVREQVGRVSEITWSKVQAAPMAIARTQSYALRQLDALAEKLERKASITDVATASKEVEETVQDWLAVLARCAQLQDGLAILELDRVLDASPEELNEHRIGLETARNERFELIARSTERLTDRINAVANAANAKVLLHPVSSPAVVQSRNDVISAIDDFHSHLGIEQSGGQLEAKRWMTAATEAGNKALETSSDSINAAKRFGDDTVEKTRLTTGRLADAVANRMLRREADDSEE